MGQRGTISQGSGRSESDIELDQRQYQESEVAQVRLSPDTRTQGAYMRGGRGEAEAGVLWEGHQSLPARVYWRSQGVVIAPPEGVHGVFVCAASNSH